MTQPPSRPDAQGHGGYQEGQGGYDDDEEYRESGVETDPGADAEKDRHAQDPRKPPGQDSTSADASHALSSSSGSSAYSNEKPKDQ